MGQVLTESPLQMLKSRADAEPGDSAEADTGFQGPSWAQARRPAVPWSGPHGSNWPGRHSVPSPVHHLLSANPCPPVTLSAFNDLRSKMVPTYLPILPR